jgi:hypothetical protein
MSSAFKIAAVSVIVFLSASSRASDSVPALSLFVLPGISLRKSSEKQPRENEAVEEAGKGAVFSVERSESSSATSLESGVQRYEGMNGLSALIAPPAKPDLGGAAGFLRTKVFDPITTPEVVRFHRVQFTGGLVGALKKGNPFYLLNPLIFAMDW